MTVTVLCSRNSGLVSVACLAEMSNDVPCVDGDPPSIEMLESGEIPIREPVLQETVRRNMAAALMRVVLDAERAVNQGTV